MCTHFVGFVVADFKLDVTELSSFPPQSAAFQANKEFKLLLGEKEGA